MLSLKSPATVADGRLIPTDWSFENYSGIFKQSIFTRRAASTRSASR